MLPAALIISLRDSRLSAQPWMACRPLGTINSLHHPVAIVASIIILLFACSLTKTDRRPTRK
jgi:hypothetical protein